MSAQQSDPQVQKRPSNWRWSRLRSSRGRHTGPPLAALAIFALISSLGLGSTVAAADELTEPPGGAALTSFADEASSGEAPAVTSQAETEAEPESTSEPDPSPSEPQTSSTTETPVAETSEQQGESSAEQDETTTTPDSSSETSSDGHQTQDALVEQADESPTISPMSVPTPGAGEAVITVKVGSDRSGVANVTPLAGVVLHLYTGGENAPSATRADGVTGDGNGWARCVSDADGDCSFTVPQTGWQGGNRDARFWVVQHSTPAGYFMNQQLRTGDGDGGSSVTSPYRFRTGSQLRAGTTYTSTADFMIATGNGNASASGGVWQQSRTNPTLPQTCGLDVALVMDISGSVGDSITQLKGAGDTLIDSLVGTDSRVALFSFSNTSPGSGATQNYPSLASVSTATQADAIKTRYATWTSGGGTNWDRALAVTAQSPAAYDVVVVITDGNPTYYNNPVQGPGDFTRVREVENGIFSANAVKAEGTRVIALGVGSGVTGAQTALNLAAISGPTPFTGANATQADYFQTADYSSAGQALRELALGNCAGSISVVKQIVPAGTTGEDVTGAYTAGAGWRFDATTTSTQVTGLPANQTTDASGTGAVNFALNFAAGTTSAPVTITETQQDGYTLVTQSGANAVCHDLGTNAAVAVTNAGTLGFTVSATSSASITCTVYNREAQPQADVTVHKQWSINGVTYENGAQPSEFAAAAYLTGPGEAAATMQAWSQTRTGYAVGDTLTVSEQVTIPKSRLCSSTSEVSVLNGETLETSIALGDGYAVTLNQQHTTLTIRNTVTCTSQLTLIKRVANGDAAASDWTLTATPAPGTGEPLISGTTGVTGEVTPNVTYVLREQGDARYRQIDVRTEPLTHPSASGSWYCVEVDDQGQQIPGFNLGLSGGIAVPFGMQVRCEAVNETATLTLLKTVVNDDGGVSRAEDWQLTATPAAGVAGLTAQTVTGSTGSTEATTLQVRPDHVYTVSEAGPDGYTGRLQHLVDDEWVDVEGWSLSVAALGDETYRIVNDDQPRPWTIAKSASPGSGETVNPGDVITYTVTASAIAAPAAVRDVVLTDDLSAVLEHAGFVSGSAELAIGADPAVAVADPTGTHLVTQAFDLPAGASATLTYRVVVADDAHGVTLRNVVTGTADVPPTSCASDAVALEEWCSTTHHTPESEDPGDPPVVDSGDPPVGSSAAGGPVPTGGLATTGLEAAGVIGLAGMALVFGALMVIGARRRPGMSDQQGRRR